MIPDDDDISHICLAVNPRADLFSERGGYNGKREGNQRNLDRRSISSVGLKIARRELRHGEMKMVDESLRGFGEAHKIHPNCGPRRYLARAD